MEEATSEAPARPELRPTCAGASPSERFSTHQNSYSFPGSGITVVIPGSSLAILDSNQETAGGSPCTKITILGEIFRM